MRDFLVAVVWIVVCVNTVAIADDRVFNFQLPWDDASHTLTDLSFLNHRPAGGLGHVTVGADGRLYAGDQRVRFFGVNFTFRSAMPVHEVADKIAPRLAKFGVNIVRFHLIDANWGSGGIIDPSYPDTRHLDPAALDRLDYFIARLKENGVYADINLLTGRDFKAGDGLDPSISSMDWKAKQTPAMFDPTMIALQKEYAAQLLDRVNPYTGLSYKTDPAIAIVEVVNEHGLMHAWHSGMIDALPRFYSEELRSMWNGFLRARYEDQSALAEAWQKTSPAGPELLINGDFSSGMSGWSLEQHAGARATARVIGDGPEENLAVEVRVTATSDQQWHVQLNQSRLPVATDTVYTLRFWARADRAKAIQVVVEQAHDPWSGLGFSRSVKLDSNWRRFDFTLTLTGSDANARLNFRNLCDQLATYWFADVSLAPGGAIGLFPEEDLDAATVRLVTLDEAGQRTETAKQDWFRFLWEKEDAYWRELRDYLKSTLGVKALTMGTVVGNSTPNLMSRFDMVDSHAYWQHPSFLVSWGSPWWIRNSSMVGERDGGTLSSLSLKRVQGKPFSVSEYNHPFPNSFGSEAFLLLSAYAGFQDWDALFAYTYADGTLNWSEDRQNGYFDLQHDPGKMIGIAQSVLQFRRGDVAPGRELATVAMNKQDEVRLLPAVGSWRLLDAEHVGMPHPAGLLHRVSIVAEGGVTPAGAIDPSGIQVPSDRHFVSDTGELDWDPVSAVFKVNSSRTKGLIGYVTGRTYDLGGVIFRPQSSLQNWVAVSMTLLQGDSLATGARKILVSAHGLVQNTGLVWAYYPSNALAGFPPPADVNLTLTGWGAAPVQAEGVQCEFVLPYSPRQVTVFALDAAGERKSAIPVSEEAGGARFQISSAARTLWYEVSVRPAPRPRPTHEPSR